MDISREEFNGLGSRLNQTQMEVSAMAGKLVRGENDIQALFKTCDEIKKSNETNKWQVFALVSIPVLLLIVKTFIK